MKVSVSLALTLLPMLTVANVCNTVLWAWRDMGGTWAYGDGCSIPGVRMNWWWGTVEEINWIGRGLNGQLSGHLGNIPNLMRLYLDRNQIYGHIPWEFHRLTNLRALGLSENRLWGNLGMISHMPNLRVAYLWLNQFSGPIPENLNNIQELRVGGNQLSGALPTALNRIPLFSVKNNPLEMWNSATFRASTFGREQLTQYVNHHRKKRAFIAANIVRYQYCNLNWWVWGQEILAQCVNAVIDHCSDKGQTPSCQSIQNDILRRSEYSGLEVCAPWSHGRNSHVCAVTAEHVKSRFNLPSNGYKKDFVDFVRHDWFGNRDWAPCNGACNY